MVLPASRVLRDTPENLDPSVQRVNEVFPAGKAFLGIMANAALLVTSVLPVNTDCMEMMAKWVSLANPEFRDATALRVILVPQVRLADLASTDLEASLVTLVIGVNLVTMAADHKDLLAKKVREDTPALQVIKGVPASQAK